MNRCSASKSSPQWLAAAVASRRAMATLACYIAGLCKHDLVRGERGVLLIIAPDQTSGRHRAWVMRSGVRAVADPAPTDRQQIERCAHVDATASRSKFARRAFRRLRGPTYVAIIADEAAFWYSDEFSVNADAEILNAVRPGLATTDGPLIIASSALTPSAACCTRRTKQHYGNHWRSADLGGARREPRIQPEPCRNVLSIAHWSVTTLPPVPSISQNSATTLRAFVDRENVEACISLGVHERAPHSAMSLYAAFVDPSGGNAEAMTLAVGHSEDDVIVLDCIRERRAPFNPDDVVA